ncbi:MAG: hypothetical protein AMXMBFR64_01590 [Myxococcales bacterium]
MVPYLKEEGAMKTDAQVKRLMMEMEKRPSLTRAAEAADMARTTARRYRDLGKLPSELKEPRSWRTRADPFEEAWPEVVAMLEQAPELQAPSIFEYLSECAVDLGAEPFQEGQLRTLYRRIKQWREQYSDAPVCP